MKLRLHEYKFNDYVSVIEYWNDARKDESIPKYEYHLLVKLDNTEIEQFCFGCDFKFGNGIYALMSTGYFNSFIDEALK